MPNSHGRKAASRSGQPSGKGPDRMTIDPSTLRPATRLVQGGVQRTAHGETAEALFLTSGYVYDDAEQAEATFDGTVEHYQYSRFANPTLTMLEERLCLIEGAEACRTTATGMAAVNAALLSHLKAGDRVVASRALVRLLSLDRFDIAAKIRHRVGVRRWLRSCAMARRLEQANQSGAAGNAVEPDAGNCRSAGGRELWRTPPERSSWSTTCSRPRCCSSR